MKNIEDFRLELESNLAWRLDEIRFFSNIINVFSYDEDSNLDPVEKEKNIKKSESDKSRYRRSLVLILYSHLEGFFKDSLLLYLKYVNDEQIKISEAIDVLATASLSDSFNNYDSLSLNNEVNEDDKLYIRHLERNKLMREILDRQNNKLVVYNDENIQNSIINTESNLKPDIIKKIYHRIGFDQNAIKEINGPINHLLNIRNSIAHGDKKFKDGISDNDFIKIKKAFDLIVNDVKEKCTTYFAYEKYKK